MKKLWIGAVVGLLVFASCADKKENREEFKADHNKDSMRNDLGDSAVANSEKNSANDTANLAKDSTESPTNYKMMPPNTEAAGSR